MLLATFLTGLLLSGQCYALQFSPYSNATESARIEIIRENITQLDESHLTWLGGEVSNIHWNHWFTKAQRHRNADYQYKVRVSLFNINATKGNIKFGGKEVPLNIEPSEDYETYYPKYFYDIDNLIEKFSATTVTLNVDNATNSTEIPTLDETDFPDKANVDIDFENKTLTASNIPKQASWAYAETWETKNDEYNFLNQKFEMLNSTVPFNFDYSKASYNASKKYFYHFSTGWANENGISYRTYQWGLLKDNTNINMFNNQLDATYHGQKYGLAGENAI